MTARPPLLVLSLLVLALLVTAALSLLAGAGGLHHERFAALFLELRGLRLAAAMLVGAGLAVAGTVMQGLFRNPLADPGVIGTSAGATFGGMVAVLVHHIGLVAGLVPAVVLLPVGCVAGALVSLWFLVWVSRKSPDTLTVLLVGVILAMLFASMGAALSAWAQGDWQLARSLLAFSFGTVDAKGPEHILLALPLVAGGCMAAWCWRRELDLLLTGEAEAASLGLDLGRARRWLICWATLPVAGAVAIGGSIAFVGLVVPHLLRGIVGPSHGRLLPCAAVGGALFVLLCDILTRLLPTEGAVPLGVISGLVGAPLFLYLLVRSRREAGL